MTETTESDRTLDVRHIDGQPFEAIMGALDDLEPNERLTLINSFEPEPLYGVLEQRGFSYEVTECAPEEWYVTIKRP